MKCQYCKGVCIKKGCQNRRQKYYCKTCKAYQQKTYTYKRCTITDEQNIIKLNNIGVGISGITSFTGLSKALVINKIKKLSRLITKPVITEEQQIYEVDEVYTFIGKKSTPCYITYAMNRHTKQIIDFTVGPRTKENISKIITSLLCLNPLKIFTDKLNIYPLLIDASLHSTVVRGTNHIERNNLNLRTHLKRLARKTICFSKSITMLESCLRLYFYKTA